MVFNMESRNVTLIPGTTAQFRAESGIVTAMVTHWDDQSDLAREVGASLILHRANYEALTTRRVRHAQRSFSPDIYSTLQPVLLFGDFNSPAVNLTTPNCNSCTNGAYLIMYVYCGHRIII